MAQVKWQKRAETRFPEIGYLEPLLKGRKQVYRSYIINKRFKLIYYYVSSSDTVIVADIWDTRREPKNLVSRIKSK